MDPTVLVCDADPLAARFLARQLDRAGFEVMAASQPKAAWHLLWRMQPSLLVMNYDWPKIDPLMFLERLREEKALRNLPIIVLVPADVELNEDLLRLCQLNVLLQRHPCSPRRLAVRAFEAVHGSARLAGTKRVAMSARA